MNNFDIRRFGTLLRNDFVSNARSYLALSAGIFLAHFFAQLGIFYFSLKGWTDLPALKGEVVMSDAYGCLWMVTIVAMSIGISLTFANLKTKPKRIAYLMLPASNVEKFLSRVLIFTVGVGVLNVAMFFLADVARTIALFGMPIHMGLASWEMVRMLWEDTHEYFNAFHLNWECTWTMLFTIFSALNAYLLLLLGSAIFRKQAFFKTVSIMVGGGLLLSMTVASFLINFNMDGRNVEISGITIMNTTLHMICCVAWPWLSYWLFKHITVIRRRLF